MQRTVYVIFNPLTEDLKKASETRTLPALYPTYGVANGVLKQLRGYDGYQVHEAELIIRP
jgi:hypothetical protein